MAGGGVALAMARAGLGAAGMSAASIVVPSGIVIAACDGVPAWPAMAGAACAPWSGSASAIRHRVSGRRKRRMAAV
jgi:hypothetical protein